jgi:hypothetical protein
VSKGQRTEGRIVAKRRSGWRIGGAVVAAYLLVLQAALAGLTWGAHASAPTADMFGGIICSPSTPDGVPAPDDPRALPPCCVTGCPMAAAAAPAPDVVQAPRPKADAVTVAAGAAFDVVPHALERSPRTTRAPPATA